MTSAKQDPSRTQAEPIDAGFDPDALREKYREEREKRLRSDGNAQYVEAAGDFGGTWYWNRYPGVACDIESYIYMPLLEELAYVPKEKYSRGSEIFAHCKAIAEKYDLYRDVCFQTEVSGARWDEDISRWIISTNRGDAIRARFICLANGFLQKPKLPGIPGIETFKGHSFHTSRWDYAYTGGDSDGGLTGLERKRVGIIGTGATAVQCVPHLGRSAGHLYVFQRTPSSIDVRANRPTDPEWAGGLEPGWHQHRMNNFQILTAGGFQEEDLVNDGWTDIIRKLLSMMLAQESPDLSPEALARSMELADFMKMEEIRARVDSIVEDPATAEALKPYYRLFCKRPCFHDEYLETFNRPNVTLVDTRGKGVERVTEKGVVVAGREYELDCLIHATGFEVGTDYARRAGYELTGRNGSTLSDRWRDGIRTLHGMHIHGFPNCFMLSISQSGFTVNFPHMINEQAKHIAWIIERALDQGIESLEVSQEAEAEWVDAVVAMGGRTTEFGENCTPGYYNNEGQPSASGRQGGFFFGGPLEFIEILETWRADGRMKGMELNE